MLRICGHNPVVEWTRIVTTICTDTAFQNLRLLNNWSILLGLLPLFQGIMEGRITSEVENVISSSLLFCFAIVFCFAVSLLYSRFFCFAVSLLYSRFLLCCFSALQSFFLLCGFSALQSFFALRFLCFTVVFLLCCFSALQCYVQFFTNDGPNPSLSLDNITITPTVFLVNCFCNNKFIFQTECIIHTLNVPFNHNQGIDTNGSSIQFSPFVCVLDYYARKPAPPGCGR